MSQKSKKVICHISLKDGVLDPQGVTIRNALVQLGFDDVVEVRSGKVFELTFKPEVTNNIRVKSEEICRKVLANPVIETFEVEES
jgi:phosphoribosylformylglycinamidine synthase subunit PurS